MEMFTMVESIRTRHWWIIPSTAQEIVAFADQNTHYIKEDGMQLMEFHYITSTANCAS